MKELICIVCPRGCTLQAHQEHDGTWRIEGNACPRGPIWAQEELTAPKRTVTATCKLYLKGPQDTEEKSLRLPVRSSQNCPIQDIPALLADIYALELHGEVHSGDIVLENWQGSGINIIATRSMLGS